MSTEYGFKKISDVDIVESVNESAHLIFEDAGILKRMSAKNMNFGASGVSSWNDLTDKPFGSEMEVKVSEQNIEFQINDGINLALAKLPELGLTANGQICTVTFDGTQYVCQTAIVQGMAACGNFNLIQSEETSDEIPFIIQSVRGMAAMIIRHPGQHTVSISVEKIITIPEKYIKQTLPFFLNLEGGCSIVKSYDKEVFTHNNAEVFVYKLSEPDLFFNELGVYKYNFGFHDGGIMIRDGSVGSNWAMYMYYNGNNSNTGSINYVCWVLVADEDAFADFEETYDLVEQ